MRINRRHFLAGSGAFVLGAPPFLSRAAAGQPLLTVSSRTIEVNRRAAKVFGIAGASGVSGIVAREGDRFSGLVRNGTNDPLIMHWHGQVLAPAEQDRARPDGGTLAVGAEDQHDFALTPGTHWMHSHQLTEQQLLAAPMITRERDAGDIQDVVLMLHDFSFRAPAEILAGLGGSSVHSGHGSASAPAPTRGGMGGMNHAGEIPMPGMMSGMKQHANDVEYDAYLANDRTLDDPEIIRVEKGQQLRLRVINGATATAFFLDTGALEANCIAVDGSPCLPLKGRLFPLAQGQRIDLMLTIPAEGGAFPILARVENDTRQTGIMLASKDAVIRKLGSRAAEPAPFVSLSLDERLRAVAPLPDRKPDRTFHLMLGEEAG